MNIPIAFYLLAIIFAKLALLLLAHNGYAGDFSSFLNQSWFSIAKIFSADVLSVLVLIFYMALLYLFFYRRRIWFWSLTAVGLFILLSLTLSFVGYFFFYETVFLWHHLDKWEGFEKMAPSILAEMTWPFALAYLSVILIPVTAAVWGSYSSKNYFSKDKTFSFCAGRLIFNKKSYAAVLTVLFLLIVMLGYWQNSLAQHQRQEAKNEKEKLSVQQSKMNLNAVLLLTGGSFFQKKFHDNREHIEVGKDFSWKFNTDSLIDDSFLKEKPFPGQKGKKYNVIFFVMESTSSLYSHLTINGKTIMPNFQRLEQNSYTSKNHYAYYPLSINAQYNVLSGTYNLPNHRWVQRRYPNIEVKIAPQILKEIGYRSALFHSTDLSKEPEGRFLKARFDEIYDQPKIKRPPYTTVYNWGLDDKAMIEPAISYMKKSDQPFFVTMFMTSPHHPYDTPDPKAKIFQPGEKLSIVNNKAQTIFRRYLNSLHYSDKVIGEFMQRLREEKLEDDTLIFFFSDHGEAFYQHEGNFNHAIYIYEENIRVPFYIYNPKVFTSMQVGNNFTRHIDILPTLLDILGVEFPAHLAGQSVFRSKKRQFVPLNCTYVQYMYGIRDDRYKYIYNLENKRRELYDLSLDPREQKNLAKNQPELVKLFHDKLTELQNFKFQFYKKLTGDNIAGF